MAIGALNVFKTVAVELTDSDETIYTTPTGYTAIVLMAQLANITTSTASASVLHTQGVNEYELIRNFEIPANDAASAVTGRLIVQQGESIKASAAANSTIKFTLSLLESANE
jgi:hypothetical protein